MINDCLVNFRLVGSIYMLRGAPRGHDSFVANIAQEAMKGQLPLSKWELSGAGVEQFGRSEALFSVVIAQSCSLTSVALLRCGKVILVFGPCEDVHQANDATALAQKRAVAR